jgi:purine-binding chemotaxis protein CheW
MSANAQKSDEIYEFVTFFSGGQSFSIDISQVREIRRWGPFTPVPHATVGVLGVMNLRGSVIPIYDLAARLGLASTAENPRNVIVVVIHGDQTLGLLVESVSEIMSISSSAIQTTPDMRSDSGPQAISGLINTEAGMTQIIDLDIIIRNKGSAPA